MSYILDALKKADAERERETAAVPDLYAQADAERGARAAARWPGWMLWALAAAVLALPVLAWRWFAAGPVEPVVAQAPAMPVPTPAPAPAPAPVPIALAPAPMPLPQAASVVPVTAAAPAAPIASPATPMPRSVAPPPAPVTKPAAGATPKPAASAPSDARLPTLAELPPALRSQLPALAVGGSMYSPNPASRIVILNGQVFREGDQPMDGLAVERIGLKSTVLVFRGTRFELKH